ncbi:MAG: HlyD family efflux transporter periplasmic adaptor subunit [Minisyncoccota bacterium]
MLVFSKARACLSRLPRRLVIGAAAILVIGIVGIHWLTRPSASAPAADTGMAHVTIATVASLSSATSSLPVTGTVVSSGQATILAQTSGEIVSLRHALGDWVSAGTVIAEFSNGSQRANVLQAQGAYEAAQAGLANVQHTQTTGSSISVAQADQGVQNAKNALQNALQNAYAALDDAVHAKADVLFSNPNTSSVQIILTVPDSQLVSELLQERIHLQSVFNTLLPYTTGSAVTATDANSAAMLAAVGTVTQFLNNLITAVNETPPSQSASSATLASYAASLSAARAEVTAGLSGLIAAKSAYDNALSGSQSAVNIGTNGTRNSIALAEAQVKQALGAYDAARANLENTIVRSPIDGIIVSLPVTQGDYVSAFSPVAIVSNPQALSVETSVTSSEARTLAVGNQALINGQTSGVITFIAPALNPLTGKREVKIGVPGSARASLSDGETVSVVLDRTLSATSTAGTPVPPVLSIPIAAVKMTPNGAVVFTVSTSSAVVAQTVTLGNIIGNTVTILSGVTSDQSIVTDARGLANGQTVIVNTQ